MKTQDKRNRIISETQNNSFIIVSEDNQNMDDFLEESIIYMHDIHEADSEILIEKDNSDTETLQNH